MKRFFRIIAWFVGVLLVLLLAGQLFLTVRQSSSEKQLVHRDSESILRVNVDKLLLGMGKNALSNLREYLADRKDSLDRDERINLLRAGISIPANLYFFSTIADSATFYTLLTLKDKDKFQRYIEQYTDREVEVLDNNGLWYMGDERDRLCFMGNDQHVLMSWALSKHDRRADMSALLMSPDLVAVQSLDVAPLSKSKSELTYYNLSNQNFWQADFSRGKVEVAGRLMSESWVLSDRPEARDMDSDNVLSIWLHADIRPALMYYQDFFEQYAVDIDSIQSFIGNYWELQWKPSTILQQDTVISYDYDDNFEMVEREMVRDTPVPDIRVAFRASPHLAPYLPEKMFYRFRRHIAKGLIQLSTDEDAVLDAGLKSVEEHFRLWYHPNTDGNMLTEHFPWAGVIREVELKGRGEDNHSLRLKGRIEFEKTYIHPLKQLLDVE